ncbi:MAG: LamG domain-containing protein, partial [Thermoplasmata archaeon]|nr:LamG domain-containing protein [Thermoplasmata archaeon]
LITSTSDFDAGTKSDTVTATDDGNVPSDQLHIKTNAYVDDPNLVMYLPLNEGSGGTTNDKTTNNNDGTLSGATWNSGGKYGSCLYLSGGGQWMDGDCVEVDHDSSLDITGSLSIEAWIKATGSDAYNFIVDKYSQNSGATWGYSFYLDGGKIKLGLFTGSTGNKGVTGTSNLKDNNWHFVTGVYNGNSILVYVDGVLENSGAYTLGPGSTLNKLGVGKRLSGWGAYGPFLGRIDEVRVYDRALTQTEIQTHYNGVGGYRTLGDWQSASQVMPNNYRFINSILTFSGLTSGVATIDKIEWRVNDVVKTAYETTIQNDGLSPLTINENDLTFGSFNNIDSDFKVKVYLTSDGTQTPIIEQIEGYAINILGTVISTPITIAANNVWDTLTIDKTEP